MAEEIKIHQAPIRLEQALKLALAVQSGAEAKKLIQDGQVLVNGTVCRMRGKKLQEGDALKLFDQEWVIREE